MRLRVLFPVALALAAVAASPAALAQGAAAPAEAFHSAYAELLAQYWRPPVTVNGIRTTVFDYASMTRAAEMPDSAFRRAERALERVEPGRLSGDAAKAFWINAYNFGAMRLVVEDYPVDSIRSLRINLFKYPWANEAVMVGGRGYSLKEIEHDALLARFDDPRIVFAVSCAAVSCPDRIAEPFRAASLDDQMNAMIETFLSNPTKGMRLDRQAKVLTLSWIFDKDRHLFARYERGAVGFAARFLSADAREWLTDNELSVRYFDHDWTLNDSAQASQ